MGTRVCALALRAGWSVVSVARRGPPPLREAWMSQIFWHTADALEPQSWAHHLTLSTAVVCCVGTTRERPNRGSSFVRINGDAPILAANCAARAGVGTFVFLSAAEKPLLAREEFLSSKRRAELAMGKLPLKTCGCAGTETGVAAQLFQPVAVTR